MMGLDPGELEMFISWTIAERWIFFKKAMYAYELAWIFDNRDRGTIGHALTNLTLRGEIEPVDPDYRGKRKWFKPTREREDQARSFLTPDFLLSKEQSSVRKLHDIDCPCVKMPRREEAVKSTIHVK